MARTVPEVAAGTRLDVFLAAQPEVGSRSQAQRLLAQGLVEVPGERARPGLFLAAGQVVRFLVPAVGAADPLQPGAPLPGIQLLYDDPDLCAIDKPPGLAAHPPEDRSDVAHTVASWARTVFGALPSVPDADRPGIVHRLDRDTTGVMVVAKTQTAFDSLRAQFRDRTAQKEYRCIVYGEPRFHSDWIERPIGPDPRRPDRMATLDDGGREASTYYEVVERFDGIAHVLCRPRTGRTHQIRVHMMSIGHSLVGDRVYRSRRRQHDCLPADAPLPDRQCLHALRLVVQHPATLAPLALEAPLPHDMLQLLEWLRANRPARG